LRSSEKVAALIGLNDSNVSHYVLILIKIHVDSYYGIRTQVDVYARLFNLLLPVKHS